LCHPQLVRQMRGVWGYSPNIYIYIYTKAKEKEKVTYSPVRM
jgi:hypothetical protein